MSSNCNLLELYLSWKLRVFFICWNSSFISSLFLLTYSLKLSEDSTILWNRAYIDNYFDFIVLR